MQPPYRSALPQLDGRLWLTDGGIETTLIFREGLEKRICVLEKGVRTLFSADAVF